MKRRKILILIQSSIFESPCHFSGFGDGGWKGVMEVELLFQNLRENPGMQEGGFLYYACSFCTG